MVHSGATNSGKAKMCYSFLTADTKHVLTFSHTPELYRSPRKKENAILLMVGRSHQMNETDALGEPNRGAA